MLRRFLLIVLMLQMILACGEETPTAVPGTGSESSSSAPANAVTLRMAYGSEKQSWLTAVTEQFNTGNFTTPDGTPIHIEAIAMGSGESLQMILDGTQQIDLWSPASSLYLPIGQQEWRQRNNADLFDESAVEPLVLSPVVIAMWRPMAQALGWPDRQISWHDLAEIVSSGKSWADYGHPEWGDFQFGHTHPQYSNSGLSTIIALGYAALNKTTSLTPDDVQQPQTAEFINAVQQGVIHYGSSTGFFADKMFNRGPSYLSAAVMYENLVIESYNQAQYPELELPVVALYPTEGSFWSDHPFVVVNTPGMTDEKRAAAQVYKAYLLATEQQERALEYGFRPANLAVELRSPVDTSHGIDPAQLQTALPVPSVEVIQNLLDVWQQNKKQVDVAVILDTSGSMRQDNRLREAKAALDAFLTSFADNDRVSLTTFSTDMFELSPLGPIGEKRTDLRDRVGGLVADGDTRLYDTISDVYTRLNNESASERIRAIVVLTDGEDTASTTSIIELLEEISVGENGQAIKVFTIAYGGEANLDILTQIAERSGAKSYAGDPETIEQVYADIATFF